MLQAGAFFCLAMKQSPVAPSKPAIERARAAADALTSALGKRLFEELGANGPVAAV